MALIRAALITRCLALAVALMVALAPVAVAQESDAQTVVTPDARSLAAGWWNFIEDAGPDLDRRIEALINSAEADVSASLTLNGAADDTVRPYLERLRNNLRALPALVSEAGSEVAPVPLTATKYSLAEYLQIERDLRQTRRESEELAYSIRRGENAVRAAQRRIDGLLASYLALNVADPSRVRAGLQIMALRSEWATTRQQLRVRNETQAALTSRIDQLEALLGQAEKLLVATPEEAAAIEQRSATLQTKLENIQTELRDRQSRALGAPGDTPEQRSQSALRELRVMEKAVAERAVEIELSANGLARQWLALALAPADGVQPLEAAQQELDRSEPLLARVRSDLNEWKQQAERDLVTLRLDDQDESVRTQDNNSGGTTESLAIINQQRLESANNVLKEVAGAQTLLGDTVFMDSLLRQRVVAEQGVVGSSIATVMLWLKNSWADAQSWGGVSLFKIGETPVTTFGLARIALILFAAVWISRLFRHALGRFGSRKEGTQSAFYTVGRLAHYVIIALAIVIGLSSIGLSFANLAIVAGALGVGIGFGLQSIVNNFVSGLILLFERSLKVGDYVQLESGVGGIVKEINVRSTLINTNDNLDILVPNSEFVSGRLTNWTLKEASRRMHIPFGVAYGSDKEKVKTAVLQGIENVPYSARGATIKSPEVWLVNFGDSSLDFELIIWVKAAAVRQPARVHATYTWAIETALTENGIEIPFPQRDLHLRSGFQPEANNANAQGVAAP